MQGFSDKALIILPRTENFNGKYDDYKRTVKRALMSVIQYCHDICTEVYCFNTDEIAVALLRDEVNWLAPCPPEDEFFVKTHCDGLSQMPVGEPLTKSITVARKKFPVKRGLSEDDRFAIAMRREKFSANDYAKSARLIFTFCTKSSSYFKVAGLPNDGRIIMYISPVNFTVSAIMSGTPIQTGLLIKDRTTNLPIYDWRVLNV